MSFSIKNIFQKGESPGPGGATTMEQPSPMFGTASPMGASPFSAAPSQNPPGFGGTLFRTVGSDDSLDSPPIGAASGGSPFSPFSSGPGNVITVGDILPQLPPEIARAGGAMPDQPVALSPQALEQAISSGQLAVPVFEVYRVCPALFQAPVSPHDHRMVALPRNKLPGLIAAHTSALPAPQAGGPPAMPQGQSPFAAVPQMHAPQASAQSPFAPALPDLPQNPAGMAPGNSATSGVRPAGSLPPRRPQGVPPAIPTQSDFAGAMPGPLNLPGQMPPADPHRPASKPMMAMPQAMPSPFASAQPPSFAQQPSFSQTPSFPSQPQTGSLLFGSKDGPPSDPELEAAPQPAPSPFSMPSPSASPFAAAQPGPQASPFAPPPVASFEVPQRFVEPEPPKIGNLPFSAQTNSPAMFTPPAMPGRPSLGGVSLGAGAGSSEWMEVSLAAVLKGQSAGDLGFDPSFIPGWITTKLPASDVRGQLSSGQVLLDLGTIIDGTDSTFKSVIAHGRRDYKVSIPTSEVFQSMPPAGAPGGHTFRPASSPAPAPAQPVFAPAPQAAPPASFAMPELPPTPTGPLQPMVPAMSKPLQPMAPIQPLANAFFGGSAAQPAPSSPPTAPLMPAAGPSPSPVPPSVGEFASTPMFMPSRPRDPAHEQAPTPPSFGGVSPLFPSAPESRPPTSPMFKVPAAPPVQESNPFFGGTPAPAPAPAQEARPASKPMNMMANMAKFFQTSEVNQAPAAPQPAPVLPSFQPQAAQPAPEFRPPSQAPSPSSSSNGSAFSLDAQVDNDQIVLRAMLGVSDKLDAPRVTELASRLPGVSACVLMRDSKVLAHGDNSPPAQHFRQQAADIARSMRTLAEVTGLDAETLSIATNDRLITFCFQGASSFGVLHSDKTPPAGLREKITLLSREVAQMAV